MKKDIEIPKVDGVYVAAVKVFNKDLNVDEWNAYIINDKDVDLEMVLIVSKGLSKDKKTAVMRHKLETLPAKSFAKIEYLQEEVLALVNTFEVSFFEGNKMFDKSFVFKANTINEKAYQVIPTMGGIQGVLVK
ncbi:hypothetical protein [Formosa algae]|uniref:Phenylalanyl-tRNA synthetase subunit alpha n=1 Tax=Formosa algae TaxID=225843 RepID=A0A9X1CAR7_9FLAO|nr:hypothetical protein [Formosa algae]MBP1838460.1 hypothetical protein [Formosa algae]MDQ0334595.1 hypothetical protein [Formosa algae]OEI79130.1 hypothetical protein AST99_15905 [Formosa algae]PNW30173.1 hypothetical protein BKP44_00495 [Formosa algae]